MPETFFNLSGQKVLIIGGGSRMGLAVANLAISLGAEVIISSRSVEKLERAVATISDQIRTYAADSSDPKAAEQMLKALAPLDHVVVTASGSAPATSIVDTPTDIARAAFNRFWLSYNVLHYAPGQIRPSGSITLLSGSSGRRPVAGYGVWGSLHGSIEALAKSATLELAPIRVNVISPGGIGLQPDRQLVQRAGQPEDVAGMVVAVMTNPAMTGAVVDIDNGERLGNWSGNH
jgi:NAD(P)-dependent dehydrogenase (short-subunit alcohol dehydrogenase family)